MHISRLSVWYGWKRETLYQLGVTDFIIAVDKFGEYCVKMKSFGMRWEKSEQNFEPVLFFSFLVPGGGAVKCWNWCWKGGGDDPIEEVKRNHKEDKSKEYNESKQ